MKTNLNAEWPTIDPGTFRHQITLLSPVASMDAGGSVVTFAAAAPPVTAWAKIDYLRGAELLKSGQDVSNVYLKVTMWYRAAFTAQCHIQTPAGNEFIVQAIENVKEMNTYMVLLCLGIGAND